MKTIMEVLLICFAFFVIGFVSGFFLRQGVGTLIFMILIFSAFKVLELLGIKTEWSDVRDLMSAVTMLGEAVYRIFKNFMAQGNAISLSFFMLGIFLGFIYKGLRQRRRSEDND